MYEEYVCGSGSSSCSNSGRRSVVVWIADDEAD